MQITEKYIGNRNVRLVFIDKCNFSKDYLLQKIIKKNIYFDYIILMEHVNWYKYKFYVYTDDFIELESRTSSYQFIIETYEGSKEYKLNKRRNKLERILND